MAELGSGIALDQNFDFDVDETGDLRVAEGADELSKDISFALVSALEGLIGAPKTPEIKRKIRDRSRRVALADDRVQAASADSISVSETSRDTFRVSMSVVTIAGTEELVFEL